MHRTPSRIPFMAGLLLIAAGFAAVWFAWNRAARLDLETGQLPYILSGGFGGLGLVLLGTAVLLLDALVRNRIAGRAANEQLHGALEAINEALGALRVRDEHDERTGTDAHNVRRRRPRRRPEPVGREPSE